MRISIDTKATINVGEYSRGGRSSTSYKTSDFIVDGLYLWWEERKQELCDLKQLVINIDNGPECSGRRTQFLLRLTEFSDETGLCIRIIYYPPYHSKYNSIERFWAGLEKSWNGYLLDTVDTVMRRAGNFFLEGPAHYDATIGRSI
jgi:hypothetical protein